MMEQQRGKVYVVGHKNPDTDSICSAIAYANLKREITGQEYVARRAGQINEETQYVLERFGVEAPKLLSNVKLQVKDMNIRELEGISPNMSIRKTWETMEAIETKTMPITEGQKLVGLITTGDIAQSYMEVYDSSILSKAHTQYKNIRETLNGELLAGDEEAYFESGKVTIGASSREIMEENIGKGDLVILGNRYESQECAVDIDVSCIVVCLNCPVEDKVIEQAKDKNIVIIRTAYDVFTVARLINQSIPVKYFMSKNDVIQFKLDDYVEDIMGIMTKKKYRDFPVQNRQGDFGGFISRRRFMTSRKKQLILVDHNEKSQAVDGLEDAEIQEIIDHHRLGNIETMGPVFFRNQPVGCTATIVYQMYQENGVEITPTIAGLLCSAIISDTLLFRSPTCTPLDKIVAENLAKIAGIELEKMAAEMFNAGSNLKGKSAEEICFQDFKQFTVGDKVFGVGQISSMNTEELQEVKDMLMPYLPEVLEKNKLNMVYFMLTNILDESSELLCIGQGAKDPIIEAYGISEDAEKLVLKGVVSRKKQLIPTLVGALQH